MLKVYEGHGPALRSIPCPSFALLYIQGNCISQAPLHPGSQAGSANGEPRQETRGREEERSQGISPSLALPLEQHLCLLCGLSNLKAAPAQVSSLSEWFWPLGPGDTTSSCCFSSLVVTLWFSLATPLCLLSNPITHSPVL